MKMGSTEYYRAITGRLGPEAREEALAQSEEHKRQAEQKREEKKRRVQAKVAAKMEPFTAYQQDKLDKLEALEDHLTEYGKARLAWLRQKAEEAANMERMKYIETTQFAIREGRRTVVTGEIEWGETVDTLRFHHPMTGSLVENPLQGWADSDGTTAHAELDAVVSAAQRDPRFVEDHAGFERVEWRWSDGHLCFEEGSR